MSPPPITVIGVGNPYRHDDDAGPAVLARLQERFGQDERVRLIELDGEPVRLVQAWQGSDTVVIVDAVRSAQPPGTIHRFCADGLAGADAGGVTLGGMALGGGHLLGLREAIELADALGLMPPTLEILGIEGAEFGLGVGLSAPVAHACERAAQQLSERIAHWVSCSPAVTASSTRSEASAS